MLHAAMWAALTVSSPSLRESAAVELTWYAPPACPTETQVRERVHSHLRPSRETPRIEARAEVNATHGGYEVRLWFRTATAQNERRFVGTTCDAVAEAVALILAAAVDPEVFAQVSAPPAPAATPMPPRAPTIASSRSRLRAAFRVHMGVAGGGLPGLAAQLGGAAALLWRRARLELGIAHHFATERRIASRPDLGVQMTTLSGSARGCSVFPFSPIELAVCGTLLVGAVRARGLAVDVPRSDVRPWLALAPGLELTFVPHPMVAMFVRADLVLALMRPRFAVENVGPAYTARAIGGQGLFGVELRFP